MLDKIREHGGGWGAKLALGAIALVFIFWGFGAQGPGGVNEYALKVNGKTVPYEAFLSLYEQEVQQRRQNPRMLPDDAQERLIVGQVVDKLVEEELLLQFADEVGITVSNAELADQITKLPFLQDEKTGQFVGKAKYVEIFQNAGRDVKDFEKDVRRSMKIDKAKSFLEASVKVTPDEVKEEYRARNDKVSLAFVRVDAASMSEAMKDTPVAAKEIVDFEAKFPGLVEQLYADEKESRWTTPPKAKLLQVTVRKPMGAKKDDPKELESAKRKAERARELAATDWKKAAEQYSEGAPWEKTGEPREFSKRELPTAVAERVFATPGVDGAEVIETPGSFVVAKVVSVTPEQVTELDEKLKKQIIEEQIRAKRAEAAVEAFAAEGFKRLKAGDSLEKIAASKKLAVKETGDFTAKGDIPGIAEADPALVAKAFTLEKAGEVLALGDTAPKIGEAYLLAVLKERKKPTDEDFEKQKTWVEAGLKRERSADAFRAWKEGRFASAKIVENRKLIPAS